MEEREGEGDGRARGRGREGGERGGEGSEIPGSKHSISFMYPLLFPPKINILGELGRARVEKEGEEGEEGGEGEEEGAEEVEEGGGGGGKVWMSAEHGNARDGKLTGSGFSEPILKKIKK